MSASTSPPARCSHLLGPNGAGKTSTIMAIMGHVDIHGGRILLEGEDITRRRAIDRVGLGISLVPEGRQLFSDLTVDENLTAGGYARPAARDAAKRDRVFGIFSAAARAPDPIGRIAVGRRAADAGDRPGADGRTAAVAGR